MTDGHIDQDEGLGKQRVVAFLRDRRLIAESATFLGQALKAAWDRASQKGEGT